MKISTAIFIFSETAAAYISEVTEREEQLFPRATPALVFKRIGMAFKPAAKIGQAAPLTSQTLTVAKTKFPRHVIAAAEANLAGQSPEAFSVGTQHTAEGIITFFGTIAGSSFLIAKTAMAIRNGEFDNFGSRNSQAGRFFEKIKWFFNTHVDARADSSRPILTESMIRDLAAEMGDTEAKMTGSKTVEAVNEGLMARLKLNLGADAFSCWLLRSYENGTFDNFLEPTTMTVPEKIQAKAREGLVFLERIFIRRHHERYPNGTIIEMPRPILQGFHVP
ncbi:hypothetical protein CDD80_2544 [Ophiocordyceps camponoti-rufipedis]|uniref:Uncharacterized protein n=1 Tax=Ophiocordyceps camponoti-rufipedis TaxID=2004952 RepID=A0A2C5ZJY8_9HYPO|nr:hypothetical protein CDD80_2544 [Ophiocordyceps camponoti-rufipedis]